MHGLSALDFRCSWLRRPPRIHRNDGDCGGNRRIPSHIVCLPALPETANKVCRAETSVHILKYRYEPLHIPACAKDVRMVSIAYGMVQSELPGRLHFRSEPYLYFADYLWIPARTKGTAQRFRWQTDEGNVEIHMAVANLRNHRHYEPSCRQDLLPFHRSRTGRRNPAWNLWCLREDCNDYGDDYPGFPLRIRAVCLRRKPRRSQEEQGNAGKGDEIFCHLHIAGVRCGNVVH